MSPFFIGHFLPGTATCFQWICDNRKIRFAPEQFYKESLLFECLIAQNEFMFLSDRQDNPGDCRISFVRTANTLPTSWCS